MSLERRVHRNAIARLESIAQSKRRPLDVRRQLTFLSIRYVPLCLFLVAVAVGCKAPGPCSGEVLTAQEEEVYLGALRHIIGEGKGRVLSPATVPPSPNMFETVTHVTTEPVAELERVFPTRTQSACLSPLGEEVGIKVGSESRAGLIRLTRIAFVGDWAYCQATISGRDWLQQFGWAQREGFLFNRTPTGWKLVSVHLLMIS